MFVDDFSLDVVGQGDVTCRHGKYFSHLSCAKPQCQSVVCFSVNTDM
jgi:hypothetical protein